MSLNDTDRHLDRVAPAPKIHNHVSTGGAGWFTGWLFTIGFLKLSMPKILFALLLWPYFLGAHFADARLDQAVIEAADHIVEDTVVVADE